MNDTPDFLLDLEEELEAEDQFGDGEERTFDITVRQARRLLLEIDTLHTENVRLRERVAEVRASIETWDKRANLDQLTPLEIFRVLCSKLDAC